MKLFSFSKDGGPDSNVSGFFLVEIKSLFSIAVLKFANGSREAYHDHAFNCLSWLIQGKLIEHILGGGDTTYLPSFKPIRTEVETFHKVESVGNSYVFTIRGPWSKEWHEYIPETREYVTLSEGRVVKEKKLEL